MLHQFSNRWTTGLVIAAQYLKMMIVIQKTIKAFKNMDKPMNAPHGIRKLIHRTSIISA